MSTEKMKLVSFGDGKQKKIEVTHESRVLIPVESVMAFLLENWDAIPRVKRDIFEAELLKKRLVKGDIKLVDEEEKDDWF